MESLPRDARVVVVGTSCAGKTTFARALSKRLSVPFVELDELHWLPNWRERPDAEFRRLVEDAVSLSAWVADGNYGVARDILWPRANVIVWLDYCFALVLWRGLKRSIEGCVTGEALWHGNRESFRRTFFSRDSIIAWILKTHKRRSQQFAKLRESAQYSHLRWIVFRRPSEAVGWLARAQCIKSA